MNYDKQDNYDYNRQPQDADPDDSGDFGYYAEIKDYDADDDAAAQDSMEEYSIPEEPSESGSSGKSTGEGGAKPRMRPVAWRLMLEVLSNPVEGWKAIRRNKLSPAKTQSECFYPMVSVVAITEFAVLFYNPGAGIAKGVVDALCGFVAVFFSYFAIIVMAKLLMPGDARRAFDTNFGKVFVLISLSTLAVFYSLLNLLPMLEPILVFLPLWTVYIICRGARFLKFPKEREHLATGILCLLTVGMPWLLGLLFSKVINYQ